MEKSEQIQELIGKYLKDDLSAEERTALDQWIAEDEKNAHYFAQITDEDYMSRLMADYYATESGNDIKKRIKEGMDRQAVLPFWPRWRKYAAVAATVVLFGGGAYLWKQSHKPVPGIAATAKPKTQTDLAPGGNKATLTLGNGQVIVLDNAGTGDLARQGKTRIIKVDAGQLAYAAGSGSGEVLYNTISTPRGGQYEVTLPDGTRVWLNASSSVHFPTAFTGDTRRVDLTGEGYFEVAKNTRKPFIVAMGNGREVKVLGTHFNIMAYPDEEQSQTTLLEGLVQVSKDGSTAILKPGQQAQIDNSGINKKIAVINEADVEQAMAWKNGYFLFKKAGIESIMRQLSRWYDVNVEYKEPVAGKFYGKIPRSSNLSSVSEILEAGGIHLQVEGRKIIVSH